MGKFRFRSAAIIELFVRRVWERSLVNEKFLRNPNSLLSRGQYKFVLKNLRFLFLFRHNFVQTWLSSSVPDTYSSDQYPWTTGKNASGCSTTDSITSIQCKHLTLFSVVHLWFFSHYRSCTSRAAILWSAFIPLSCCIERNPHSQSILAFSGNIPFCSYILPIFRYHWYSTFLFIDISSIYSTIASMCVSKYFIKREQLIKKI